jgi:hypothetical protein
VEEEDSALVPTGGVAHNSLIRQDRTAGSTVARRVVQVPCQAVPVAGLEVPTEVVEVETSTPSGFLVLVVAAESGEAMLWSVAETVDSVVAAVAAP